MDPRWSEMGDRYLVKLFRDHVFHTVDEHGRPVVSMSHVLTNLNKVIVNSEEAGPALILPSWMPVQRKS